MRFFILFLMRDFTAWTEESAGVPTFWEIPSDVNFFTGLQITQKRLQVIVIRPQIVDPKRDLLQMLRGLKHSCYGFRRQPGLSLLVADQPLPGRS